ncbi:MAG: MCE family protein [Sphingobium sp.]|nr:MCE family protein [Sphingobium sp.]MBP6111630.1 MCE family protein [Sphingobium sp.]MBP8671205.1 MCE family protein [Sphingobium sp.]MBP9158210.1 MCE family protein [Sphingobium sp.]MCC6481453.1 MCE family protein [Sphingomonadaceae bacterium]
METRSNHVLVGSVVLILLLAVMIAAFWFSRIADGQDEFYDIYFKQSVTGLAKGSGVSYAGVPSGQVKEIELWDKDPGFVRVRIAVKGETPVLQGTTATIQGVGFTGVSEIVLDGAVKGAPRIGCPEQNRLSSCPNGVPVIPTKPGALGELLTNAPQLIERLSTLTERLTELLNDKNQQSIAGILRNTEVLTDAMAASAPDMRATIAETRITVQKAGLAAEEIAKLVGTTNALLNEDGRPMIADLRKTLQSASRSLDTFDKTIAEAQPGVRSFSRDTMPEMNLLIRDLREMSRSLRAISEKLDHEGAGSLFGTPSLPDYKE